MPILNYPETASVPSIIVDMTLPFLHCMYGVRKPMCVGNKGVPMQGLSHFLHHDFVYGNWGVVVCVHIFLFSLIHFQ